MDDLTKLANDFDREKMECQVIIETPRGHRNKFKYKPKSGLFGLSHVLPEGFSFPFEFGFIPSTAADDGDPLDVFVLMDEPAHVGCLLDVRVIGVIETVQTENGEKSKNDRLVCVAVRSFEYADIKSISGLRESLIQQISEFFELYNKNTGKRDEVSGVGGPERALRLIEQGIQKFEKSS